MDIWTFTANTGDHVNLRLGTTSFYGLLQLFGPNGALLNTVINDTDELIAFTPTNSGTFTVLVSSSDYANDLTGTYVLHLAQLPEPFIVPTGDEGGPLTNGGNYAGTITRGYGHVDLHRQHGRLRQSAAGHDQFLWPAPTLRAERRVAQHSDERYR